jgi:16S rRNA (cytosine1402-N4)-methyltransferase
MAEPIREDDIRTASGGAAEGFDSPAAPSVGYHAPVLVDEVVHFLAPAEEGEILDGTVGGGGHAEALLLAYPRCRILAVDRDPDALAESRQRLAPFLDRVRFLHARFDAAAQGAGLIGPTLQGALLDLGVSSRQIDAGGRGFSFRPGVPLDMRMGGSGAKGETAASLLNSWDEERIRRLFWDYGEEPRSRALARVICEVRKERPFSTSDDLLDAMGRALGRAPFVKEKARVFQALRIEVNREMEALDTALPALRDALLPGGILVVISYHSLEDRPVKNAFREWSRRCTCPPEIPLCICRGEALGQTLTRSVVTPGAEELERNPRSRSARLRAWRKAG